MDFIKIKTLYYLNDNVKKMKGQTTAWKKIFIIHRYENRFVYRIDRKFLKFNDEKRNTPMKNVRIFEQAIYKRRYMDSQQVHGKIFIHCLKKCKLKLHHFEWLQLKSWIKSNIGKNQLQLSFISSGNRMVLI